MTNIVEILITAKNLAKPAFASATGDSKLLSSTMGKMGLGIAGALVGIGVESIKMATTFQSATTRLTTSAGESVANLNLVSKGMLNMAGQVGMSATELARGMYTVESAGEHGADGLLVLKAAAQGAKDENADLGTVANAVTDVLTDYHMKASSAADVTSKLVEAVSFGKTSFESFSKAMANVLPLAGSLHLSLADVSGVLAEMTAHGMTAQRASQNEAQAMRSLIAPTGTMTKEFKLLGINAAEVTKHMGTVGLSGTMEWLSQVAEHGSKAVGQTYTEALKKLMGTAPGLAVALMTTGENAGATAKAIKGIGAATADASGDVKGFSEVQKTLGQRLSELNAGFDSVMIRLGTALIPKVMDLLDLLGTKGTPIVHGFTGVLSQVESGFNKVTDAATKATRPVSDIMAAFTNPKAITIGGERVIGQKLPTVANLPGGERPILPAAAAAISASIKTMTPVPPPPNLTGWQKAGQQLREVFNDLAKFGGQVATAGKNLGSALQPTIEFLAGVGLATLRAVGAILSGILGPALVGLTGFMKDHKTLVEGIVIGYLAYRGALLSLSIAQKIVEIATKGVAVAQAILNAVMDANPIMATVIVIGLLALAVMYCWDHFRTFRKIVMDIFVEVTEFVAFQVKFMVVFLKLLSDGTLEAVATMLRALGHLPGFGWAKQASKDVEGFRHTVNSAMDDVTSKIDGTVSWAKQQRIAVKVEGDIADLNKKIDDAKKQLSDKNLPAAKQVTLKANITQWQLQIAAARASLQATPAKKEAVLTAQISQWQQQVAAAKKSLLDAPSAKRAILSADITDLSNNIANAQAQINALQGKTVTITYRARGGGGVTLATNATGGIIGGAATGGARGGLSWVGEQGPELVRLPTGSMVYPSGQSMGMAAQAAANSGGGVVQLEWVGGNAGDEFMRWLRKNIRITGGGDVQRALGT